MADIYVNYGENPCSMTMELMEQGDVAARLTKDTRVCIKPNLVVARPAEGGATTHPEIVEGIIRYLRDHSVEHITIAEGAWVGDSTKRGFEVCGYHALAKQYGVALVDTKKDSTVTRSSHGFDLEVCETIATADFLINVPVLKGHCQTGMTCCLKNMKGCIPDSEKRRFHSTGLHRPIAALNTVLKPQLHIIDGICGDLDFEEGGNPVDAGRVLLGEDPVLLDSYCAGLLGFQVDEVEHLALAGQWGVGRFFDQRAQVVELNAHRRPKARLARSSRVNSLASAIDEDSACSACYAALVYALDKHGARGVAEPIHIGQGFRGKRVAGPGVGNCADGCVRSVGGCPPSARDIIAFLETL